MGKSINLRTIAVAALTAVLAMSLFAGAALAQNGNGAANGKGNSARSVAEPVEITSVEAEVSDPAADNFEEEFTYYVIRFDEIEYDAWTYREPVRLGGNGDFVAEYDDTQTLDAFWFGVTAPNDDGIQNEIEHKGQVSMYFENEDGEIYSIVAQFNGQGELLWVNGVEPEA